MPYALVLVLCTASLPGDRSPRRLACPPQCNPLTAWDAIAAPGGSLSPTGSPSTWDLPRLSLLIGYVFGHGTLMLAVEVSPLRNFSSVFAGKPPLGHLLGTVP